MLDKEYNLNSDTLDIISANSEESESHYLSNSDYENIAKYMQQIKAFPMLSKEEELSLLEKYCNDHDKEAGKIIVLSHLRLVIKIALQFKNYGLPLSELISEGSNGLLHALTKFDLKLSIRRNNRFSTYAMLWIKAYIQQFILKSWSIVKVGSVALRKKLLFNFKATKKAISEDDNINKLQDSNEKLANYFSIENGQMAEISNSLMTRDSKSFDSQNSDQSENYFMNSVHSEENLAESVENEEDLAMKIYSIKLAFKILDSREQYIIAYRFLTTQKVTLDDLSAKFNISKERIRQIEENAIKKMKKFILANNS